MFVIGFLLYCYLINFRIEVFIIFIYMYVEKEIRIYVLVVDMTISILKEI